MHFVSIENLTEVVDNFINTGEQSLLPSKEQLQFVVDAADQCHWQDGCCITDRRQAKVEIGVHSRIEYVYMYTFKVYKSTALQKLYNNEC